MSDTTADKVIKQCAELMNVEQLENNSHFLELTFIQRLDVLLEAGLITEQEALSYEAENNSDVCMR